MTDITGFGFIGHLSEILKDNELVADIEVDKVPFLRGLQTYQRRILFLETVF